MSGARSMHSEIARRWLVANLVTCIVGAILGLIDFGVRNALGVSGADSALSDRAAYAAIGVVPFVIHFVVYAHMTGPVLRLIVPTLRHQSWLKVHLAMGLTIGIGLGLLFLLPPSTEPVGSSDTGMRIFLAVGIVLLGVVIGAVQANLLRRVAYGAGAWFATACIAAVVAAPIAVAILPVSSNEQTLAVEITSQGVLVFIGLVDALIMLPALWRLRPRAAQGVMS